MPLTRRHLLAALPALGAAGLGLGFIRMLHGLDRGQFDPRAINTPLTGQPVPDFPALSSLPGQAGLTREDFRTMTQPVLLSVWASWCLPCVEEIPFISQLAASLAAPREGRDAPLALWGLCYRDQPASASRWLERAGQPFTRLGLDQDGQAAIEWGVTGVPEAFLIMPDPQVGGRIVWHGTGALTEAVYQTRVVPHLEAAP